MVRSANNYNNSNNKMESTMYENTFRVSDVNRLKRNLTLDLDFNSSNNKRPKFSPVVLGVPVLSSPDVSKLKLTSPEIEKFILAQQNNLLFTPTPSTPHSKILFPKSISEQESCDFPDDLTEFSTTDSSQGSLQVELPRNSNGSNCSGNLLANANFSSVPPEYGIVLSPGNVTIKDEHQIVPSIDSTPPLSPINMESQEIIKLERKRMRNRVAASKCRKRKLERISKLEDKVKILKGENTELTSVIIRLKDEVCKLKQNVLEHVQSGCQIIVSSNFYNKINEV